MSHHIGLLFRVDNVGEVRNWRLAVSRISGWHILILLAVLTVSGIYRLLSLWLKPLTELVAAGCLGCKPLCHASQLLGGLDTLKGPISCG